MPTGEIRTLAKEFGVFRAFSKVPTKCELCAWRFDPYFKRVEVRLQLLDIWLECSGLCNRRKVWRRNMHALWIVPLALFLEVYLYSWLNEVNIMKTFVSLLSVCICIGIPIYILGHKPQDFTPLVQFLISLILTGASVWFGTSLTNKAAKKEASKAWLPAAETACKQLLTISATTARMRATESCSCESIESLLHEGNRNCEAIKALLKIQCRETSEKLATLKDHIDNGVSHWEVFITNNCEMGECDDIFNRIAVERTKLAQELQKDFPEFSSGTPSPEEHQLLPESTGQVAIGNVGAK